MNKLIPLVSAFVLLAGTTALAQHHRSNWVYRSATDTTIVQCWNDSLTAIGFPPNSMTMMMMPDSIYCRIDRMNMDSLDYPHDSTFIGWYRVQAGRDSAHFDMMNGDSAHGSRNMMQFLKNVSCQFHWDSVMADSAHRHWRPTDLRGWNGSSWVRLGSTINGNIAFLTTDQIYSAFAFTGISSGTVSVVNRYVIIGEYWLDQNYPNPFNPSTTIPFVIPKAEFVSLKVFNSLGQDIATIVNGPRAAGNHRVTWDAGQVPSGVYFYRISAGSFVQTRTLHLVR